MIPQHIKKRAYEVGHFFEDCLAADWLNEKFDEGYVVHSLSSCVVPGRYDRRKQEVQMTIIMRLELPPLRHLRVDHNGNVTHIDGSVVAAAND